MKLYSWSIPVFLLSFACRNDQKTVIEPSNEGVVFQDADGDGYESSEDCDETDPSINPGVPELCDGIDNNCDGTVDEGVLCEDNLACTEGVCSCPPEQQCGEECVDLLSNADHCGSCNTPCSDVQTCEAGTCQCEGGFTACGGSCVDLMVDLVHCGSCDTLCKGGSTCKEGLCTCTGLPYR